MEGMARASKNPFHRVRNPEGIINLGTAENHLMIDVLRDRVRQVESSEAMTLDLEEIRYSDWLIGTAHFRDAIAALLNRRLRPSHLADNEGWKLERRQIRVLNGYVFNFE